MNTIERSALVSYTPQQMFELVNHIEDYPKFLPWCQEVEIIEKTETTIEAKLIIAWGGFHKSFTTRNTLHPYQAVEIDLVSGPFKHLEGKWHFIPLGEQGCKVIVDLEFEFTGNIFDKLFEPVFNIIANSLVDAFSKRAKEVYGE
jgi:ribosome-associated toxin RatA of RatAB toxin-antitoxin module